MTFSVKSKQRDAKVYGQPCGGLPRAFITAEQVKVTRKLLGWSQDALAAVWASPRPPSAVSSSGVSLHPIQLSERSELHSKPLASSSSPANRALN